MAAYVDSALKAVIDLLDASGPVKLRNNYYIGDPVIIPKSDKYPLCFVSKDTTQVSIATTGEDMHEMAVVLNVVYDAARELNQTAWAQAGAQGLYDLVEGRDSTFNVRSDTIVGVLRNQQVIDGTNRLFIDVTGSNLQIDYVLSPPERRHVWSNEAIIRTTLKHLEVRS